MKRCALEPVMARCALRSSIQASALARIRWKMEGFFSITPRNANRRTLQVNCRTPDLETAQSKRADEHRFTLSWAQKPRRRQNRSQFVFNQFRIMAVINRDTSNTAAEKFVFALVTGKRGGLWFEKVTMSTGVIQAENPTCRQGLTGARMCGRRLVKRCASYLSAAKILIKKL